MSREMALGDGVGDGIGDRSRARLERQQLECLAWLVADRADGARDAHDARGHMIGGVVVVADLAVAVGQEGGGGRER